MFFKKRALVTAKKDSLACSEPTLSEVKLKRSYKFLYENFILSSQRDLYLLLEKSDEVVRGLKFNFSVYKYGYPNDEVGHPLMRYGLNPYSLYQVENSSWITEIRKHNSVHASDSAALHNDKRHYVVSFKDVTLEVISKGFLEIEISTDDLASILRQELDNIVLG
jgi:hypothetical protein